MKWLLIVKVEIISQLMPSRGNRVIVVEINLPILDTAPQPLNEDVVKITTFAVPTDGNISCFKSSGKRIKSKSAFIVRIEYEIIPRTKVAVTREYRFRRAANAGG